MVLGFLDAREGIDTGFHGKRLHLSQKLGIEKGFSRSHLDVRHRALRRQAHVANRRAIDSDSVHVDLEAERTGLNRGRTDPASKGFGTRNRGELQVFAPGREQKPPRLDVCTHLHCIHHIFRPGLDSFYSHGDSLQCDLLGVGFAKRHLSVICRGSALNLGGLIKNIQAIVLGSPCSSAAPCIQGFKLKHFRRLKFIHLNQRRIKNVLIEVRQGGFEGKNGALHFFSL